MAQVKGQSTESKIERRLRGGGRGSIVFQQDYADCGTPSAIKSTFHRLYTDGVLMRLAHGIYYYPKEDKAFGLGVVYPSIEDIAQAIAKRDRVKIVPTGAYALHKLGLSTQIPMNAVFLTTGVPRRIKIGNGHGILFKHSSAGKNFAFKSELMMLIVTIVPFQPLVTYVFSWFITNDSNTKRDLVRLNRKYSMADLPVRK